MKNIVLIALVALLFGCSTSADVVVKIDTSQPVVTMSDKLMGVFFEDINYAADGGLYAELVQNRSFEYFPVEGYTNLQPLDAWELVQEDGAKASMKIQSKEPLNANNTKYLKLLVTKDGKAGIKNLGFDGIAVKEGEMYKFSVYLRRDGNFNIPVEVYLKNQANETIASGKIEASSNNWEKYAFDMKVDKTCGQASLYLTTSGTGSIYFDMVSLFPENTFKKRENGMRADLAQALVDLNPQFLRFPGGCISHGRGLDNAYRWKHTVGDIAERKPNWNLWGYHQTYGLGFFEYFQLAEDLEAIPLPVVPVGISCQFRHREVCELGDMQMWIDDAIDLVEFANGDVTTEWGKVRAEMGHPEPFNMEYICLGNEEDNIPEFRERFLMITDSLRKYCPEIKIIGTSGVDDSGWHYSTLWEFSKEHHLDAVDEHYYNDPNWFLYNVERYDSYDRSGPKVFIGEWASRNDMHYNAIVEAAYMTGIEKNADIIEFACYAPLFSNVKHQQWHPDLIRFNNTDVVKTASYYVQQMYGVNNGDEYIPSAISYSDDFSMPSHDYSGKMGVGAWNTQVKYDDVKIESNGKVVFEQTFAADASEWEVLSGDFSVEEGSYVQTSAAEPAVSIFTVPVELSEYTLTLKAMKTGGVEGFLIPFSYKDNGTYYWFNIAGWANSQHAIEQVYKGGKSVMMTTRGSIENNRWYNIKIEVDKSAARCYIDDELVFEIPGPPAPVTASFVENKESNDLILKLVNSGADAITTSIDLSGIKVEKEAGLTLMTGDPDTRNSIEEPELIKPEESKIQVSNTFNCTLPAYSVQVIRMHKK